MTLSPDIKERLCVAAQSIYDAWDARDPEAGDPEHGFGGICHVIAEGFCEVLGSYNIEAVVTDSNGVGENHTWVIALLDDGIYQVDISPYVYERGAGYLWTKIPGVTFQPEHVEVTLVEKDTAKWNQMAEEASA